MIWCYILHWHDLVLHTTLARSGVTYYTGKIWCYVLHWQDLVLRTTLARSGVMVFTTNNLHMYICKQVSHPSSQPHNCHLKHVCHKPTKANNRQHLTGHRSLWPCRTHLHHSGVNGQLMLCITLFIPIQIFVI